jgi:predicted Holliday junction resolvase-like endonuclease
MNQLPPMLVLILGAIIGAAAGMFVMWIRNCLTLRSAVETASQRSVQQSRSTLKGQIAEQIAPLLPGFEYLPSDARFLGHPIDYVVFDGYTEAKDGNGDSRPIELVILDIKHGNAKLTTTQRAIAEAIEAGRVRFEMVRIAEDGTVSVHAAPPRR